MITFQDLREASPEQTLAWLETLAGDLRPSDMDEIAATSDLDPLVSLTASTMVSQRAWVILSNDIPVAIFGCGPSGHPEAGFVWMMGTPGMDDRKASIAIARATRPYLLEMHRLFPCLWNYIDARNDKSMNWLRWSGFELLEAHPEHGREGRMFFTFARYEPNV